MKIKSLILILASILSVTAYADDTSSEYNIDYNVKILPMDDAALNAAGGVGHTLNTNEAQLSKKLEAVLSNSVNTLLRERIQTLVSEISNLKSENASITDSLNTASSEMSKIVDNSQYNIIYTNNIKEDGKWLSDKYLKVGAKAAASEKSSSCGSANNANLLGGVPLSGFARVKHTHSKADIIGLDALVGNGRKTKGNPTSLDIESRLATLFLANGSTYTNYWNTNAKGVFDFEFDCTISQNGSRIYKVCPGASNVSIDKAVIY